MTISLLFLTYKNPYHDKAWIKYIKDPTFNIIIHPKYPELINETWRPFLSSKLVPTNWGSDSIIMATLILLKQSLELHNSDWYILCSEDSYPLLHPIDCIKYFNNFMQCIINLMRNQNKLKSIFFI